MMNGNNETCRIADYQKLPAFPYKKICLSSELEASQFYIDLLLGP